MCTLPLARNHFSSNNEAYFSFWDSVALYWCLYLYKTWPSKSCRWTVINFGQQENTCTCIELHTQTDARRINSASGKGSVRELTRLTCTYLYFCRYILWPDHHHRVPSHRYDRLHSQHPPQGPKGAPRLAHHPENFLWRVRQSHVRQNGRRLQ